MKVPATAEEACISEELGLSGLDCTGGKRTYTDLAPGTYAAEAAEYAAAKVPPSFSPLSFLIAARSPSLVNQDASLHNSSNCICQRGSHLGRSYLGT